MEYIIFDISEVAKIDFSKIREDSEATLRLNADKKKSFVNWKGMEEPSFLANLETSEGPYSEEQILDILHTNEWSNKLARIGEIL